jgi:opacity protein-like surface antigen
MFAKKNYCFTLGLIGLGFSSMGFAGTMGDVASSHYVATLSLGPVWTIPVKSQTYALEPQLTKTFTSTGHTNTLIDGELFLGVERNYCPKLDAQFGLAVGATSSTKTSGEVWDDGNPTFNNYTYKFRAQHTYVSVKGKLLTDVGYRLKPYLSGSAGAGFNYVYGFSSGPTSSLAVPVPNFRSNTQTAFTYTVGAGVETAVYNNFRAGVGYEFADWGQGHLSRGVGQVGSSGPSFNHLFTNGLMFSLTYLG